MAPQTVTVLDPTFSCVIYWRELDDLVHHARACIFELARIRTLDALAVLHNPPGAAMHLRQLVEAVLWGALYQFGVTVAFNILRRRTTSMNVKEYLWSSSIEEFVRSAFSSSGTTSPPTGEQTPTQDQPSNPQHGVTPDDHFVEEISATVAKQKAVAMYVAEQGDKGDGGNRAAHVSELVEAYGPLCKLVHVTPLLLQHVLPFPSPAEEGSTEFRPLAVQVITSAVHTLHELCLHSRFDTTRFLPHVVTVLPDPGTHRRKGPEKFQYLEIPQLTDLRRADNEVSFDWAGGTIPVYAKKRGRRHNRP